MNAVVKPKQEAAFEIEFQFDALITVDSLGVDNNENMKGLKAKAQVFFDNLGDVCVMAVWIHDVHDHQWGGQPYWKAFHFPRAIVRQIEHLIEDGYKKQEQR